LFNRIMGSARTQAGWSVQLHPEDNSLIISLPVSNGQYNQLAYSLTTKGWSQYRGLGQLLSMAPWGGKLYFGTADGKVCINTDYLDGVLLSDPDAFTPITCTGITRFSNLGTGSQKQVQLIRPTIISESGNASSQFEARYRYDLTEVVSAAGTPAAAGAVWDTALWDVALWGGAYATQQVPGGAAGMGPDVAIAWMIKCVSRTVLVGIDVAVTQGGML